MLHKNISYSSQVNSLTDFQKLVFTWSIPHLDDFGRIDGDAEVLKAKVMPMSSYTAEDFENAVLVLEEVGLIARYTIVGKKVIVYPTFDVYQTGLAKRTKSKFPEPPLNILDKFQEIPRDSSLTQPNQTEYNQTEKNLTEECIDNIFDANSNSLVSRVSRELGYTSTKYVEDLMEGGNEVAVTKAYKEFQEAQKTTYIKNKPAYFQQILTRYLSNK